MTTPNMRRPSGEGNPLSRRAVLGGILAAATASACVAAVAVASPVTVAGPRDEVLEEIMSLFRRLSPADKLAYLRYARCLSDNDVPGQQAALEEMRAAGWRFDEA